MNLSEIACPTCGSKTLGLVVRSMTVEHQGKKVEVSGLRGCVCATCGSDPVLTPQIRENQIRIADAKRASVGLLTSEEIKAARKLLGLSQADAAELFGGGLNAFSKYERGEIIQSVPMDKLIRAALLHPDLVHALTGEGGSGVASVSAATPAWPWKPGQRVSYFQLAESEVMILPGLPASEWANPAGANDDEYLCAGVA